MSNPKYTPGPWAVETITGQKLTIKGADGWYVCDVCGDEVPARANAGLIAEAPEMLWLLRALITDNITWPHKRRARALLARIDGED